MSVDLGPGAIPAGAHAPPTRDQIAYAGNLDAPDQRGLTPVMVAVLAGQLDTAVQLALNGADLNCRDAQGHTALELAVLSGKREVRVHPVAA